ncbi:MAG: ATP-binding protein [Candidatus Acidiferrales bacterium]
MSFETIKRILDNRQFVALIGRDEDTWLEAKGRNPYDFATPAGRYELAKDVTAFANAEGGILLIGLTTAPAAETKTDRITAHDLCPQAEFDVAQYSGIIKEHVYPALRDLKIYWLPVNDEATHGLGVIEVPPQSQNQKYFLMAKVVDSGVELKQIVFGIAKRNDSSNDPFTIAELYKYTQNGKHSVPQTIARVEAKLDAFIEARTRPAAPTKTPGEVYDERTARILDNDPL